MNITAASTMSTDSNQNQRMQEPVDSYKGPGEEDIERGSSLKPHKSHASIFIQNQVHIFHSSLRDIHFAMIVKSLLTLLYMAILIMAILSVFWGSTYKRTERTRNLNVWVIDYDGGQVGQSLVSITETLAQDSSQLGFQTVTPEQYGLPIESVFNSANEQVAWGILAIPPNATANLIDAVANNGVYNSSNAATFYAPQGRSLMVQEFMVPMIVTLNNTWTTQFSDWFVSNLTTQYSQSQIGRLLVENKDLINTPVQISIVDTAPVRSDVSTAILSVGLIFLIIVSFFQIPNFAQIQLMLLGKVPFYQYMLYRPFFNMLTILILSLAFSLVSVAFQQDFSAHFGPQRGFMIYWMINFMAMWSLGGVSENIAGPLMAFHPPALGFWLIFWVVLNASTGMYPLELSPAVFRIGRALPVYNAQMAIRTVLFGTKNNLGMNFGIFAGWAVVNWVMSFPSFLLIKTLKIRAAKKEAAAAAAAAAAKKE